MKLISTFHLSQDHKPVFKYRDPRRIYWLSAKPGIFMSTSRNLLYQYMTAPRMTARGYIAPMGILKNLRPSFGGSA